MIAHQRNQVRFAGQGNQSIDRRRAFGATVDIVAQRDHRVVGRGADSLQQPVECQQATVNIANGNRARHERPQKVPTAAAV